MTNIFKFEENLKQFFQLLLLNQVSVLQDGTPLLIQEKLVSFLVRQLESGSVFWSFPHLKHIDDVQQTRTLCKL